MTALDLSRLTEHRNELGAAVDSASYRLEEWRRTGHRASYPHHLRRTSTPGGTLFKRRARGQYAPAHRTGARSVHQAGGAEYARLGVSVTFLRGCRAPNAPNSGGPCPA